MGVEQVTRLYAKAKRTVFRDDSGVKRDTPAVQSGQRVESRSSDFLGVGARCRRSPVSTSGKLRDEIRGGVRAHKRGRAQGWPQGSAHRQVDRAQLERMAVAHRQRKATVNFTLQAEGKGGGRTGSCQNRTRDRRRHGYRRNRCPKRYPRRIRWW